MLSGKKRSAIWMMDKRMTIPARRGTGVVMTKKRREKRKHHSGLPLEVCSATLSDGAFKLVGVIVLGWVLLGSFVSFMFYYYP